MRYTTPSFLLLTFLSACGISQLNSNAVELGSSIDDLYTRQVLVNLSKFIDAENAIPSQVDIAAGTVQTNRSVSPSVSFPFSDALTTVVGSVRTVSAAVTTQSSLTKTNTTPSAGASVAGTSGWQQNWTIAPVTDANTLRRLRALYRYVIYETDLRREYLPASQAALAYPQCVLCTEAHHINRNLKSGWLYWSSAAGGSSERLPPPGESIVDLGRYGHYRLYMLARDYQAGYLANFTLFTMPNAFTTKKSEVASRESFQLIVPQQILPAE